MMTKIGKEKRTGSADLRRDIRLSVIVPVHNGERYLKACLDSLCRQTYTALELVVVDDGSTDSSGTIIENVKKNFPKTPWQVIRQEQQGLVGARQTGIAAARGDYVGFVDADDWVDTDYFATLMATVSAATQTKAQAEIAGAQGADIVCGGYIEAYEADAHQNRKRGRSKHRRSRNKAHPAIRKSSHDATLETLSPEEALYHLFNRSGVYQYAWNKVYRKSRLEDLSIPEGNFIGEDFALVTQAINKSHTVVLADTCGYHYRQHEKAMTKRTGAAERLRSYAWYKDYVAGFCGSERQTRALHRYMMLEYMYCLLQCYRDGHRDARAEAEILAYVREHRQDYLQYTHDVPGAKYMARFLNKQTATTIRRLARWRKGGDVHA